MPKIPCPECGSFHAWLIRRGKRKCRECGREFPGDAYPVAGFRATAADWRRCVRAFLRERAILALASNAGLSQYMAERMAMRLRALMTADSPSGMAGPVEMDETYIGGQRKNKRLHIRRIAGKRGHGTDKLPIFGAFDRASGTVLVAVEPRKLDIAFIAATLLERAAPGVELYTDGFKMYRGLASRGFRHQWVDHDGGELARGEVHTNNIEGFWGILKRELGCIGGMRRKYLHLFVGEIAWRFNHRRDSVAAKERALMKLVLRR